MSSEARIIEILKKIILDFQEVSNYNELIRSLNIQVVPKKATVCLGVRRSGKSTYMHQLIQQLLNKGVPPQNILHVNFFDDRLYDLQQTGLGIILEAYYSLYPEKKNTETIYCFFDEIQIIHQWEQFVERLMRTEQCEVYITGSSAHMLSKEIATQMRGRALAWEIFPFSFQEFLDYQKVEYQGALSSKKQLLVRKEFDSYWQIGGFPEVVAVDDTLRVKIHQEYFSAILFRDLIERHDISHPKALIDLAHWLTNNIASLYSINKLANYLKSLGHKLAKSNVSDYLAWFEDAYFFFSVSIFDASVTRTNINPKKIYCIDHALVTSVASGILVNAGHRLENLVFVTLRRVFSKIYYYRTRNGREADFIIKRNNGSCLLIQVCESIENFNTKNREVNVLNEAMQELQINSSFIVTHYEEAIIETEIGKIQVIPIWRFLLDINEL